MERPIKTGVREERLSANRVLDASGDGGLLASPRLQLHQHDLKGVIA
jgi:hypothetical protein